MNSLLRHGLSLALGLSLVLGSYRGYVALFDPGSTEPRRIYPYKVCALPQEDREALEKGISVKNEEELGRFLEDYLS